jgi:hypothetical protein
MPNLALMKLSAWHKSQGHSVVFPYDYQDMFAPQVDKVYASVVFSENREQAGYYAKLGAEVGGTGWDLTKCLPPEIEAIKPDYSLYGVDYGLGFTSRGCIRQCSFCVVPVKEGSIRHVCMPSDLINPNSKELILLDNNFLASPLWREKARQIIDNGYKVDFTQGLDIRLVNQEEAEYIAAMKHRKRIHFAFDHLGLERDVRHGVELLLKQGIHPDRISFYILVNFNSTLEQDLQRIAVLDEYGVNSFVMVYDKANAPKRIKHLARWCNKYQTKKSCKFKDYASNYRSNHSA